MDGGDDLDPDHCDRLDRAMAEFFAAEDAGDPLSPESWLERHPDLRPELIAFLSDHSGMQRLVELAPRPTDGAESWQPTTFPCVGPAAGEDDFSGPSMPDGSLVKYFGDYELIGVLGRGGMGVVFKVRQISLGRYVALKMIRNDRLAEDEDLRRFWIEAETVARLEHPGILPILEIGKHDGRHYFSMPVIVGGSLADHLPRYFDDHKEAARLVLAASEAIHHAHQRGILHRDLKPANILIDADGLPRVSDFGLAKRLDEDGEAAGLTPAGAILGTPSYMAPEQAGGDGGDITTAVDVYGLGAVLYAMLTGRPPFSGSPLLETLRQVREVPPEPPRRLNRRVGRGLEKICLKCLEKDPRRRYASAAALAEDLRRWGRGEPVEARPVGWMVRFTLWCRRRPAVAGLAGLLALSLAVGIGGVIWQWREAEHQRRVSQTIDGFFRETFLGYRDPMGYAYDRRLTVEALFDRASARFEAGQRSGLKAPVEVEAGVREAIGNTYHALGRNAKAEAHLRRSHELYRAALGPAGGPTLDCEQDLASLLLDMGQAAEAGQLAREAYSLRLAGAGPRDRNTLVALATLAATQRAEGQPDQAERSYRASLAGLDDLVGPGDLRSLAVAEGLALTIQRRGKLDEAEAYHRRAWEGRKRSLPRDHPLCLESCNNLAACLIGQGKLDQAETIIAEALEGSDHASGEQHPKAIQLQSNLAALFLSRGDLDRAEPALRRALDRQAGILAEHHPDILANWSNLATVYSRRSKPDLAISIYERVLLLTLRVEGERSFTTARARYNLGVCYFDWRQYSKSASLFAEALPAYREGLPALHSDLALLLNFHGSSLLESGMPAEAEHRLREALAIRRKILPAGSWQAANTESLLGGAIAAQHRPSEAGPLLIGAFEALRASPEANPVRVEEARARLVKFYEDQDMPAEAARCLEGRTR